MTFEILSNFGTVGAGTPLGTSPMIFMLYRDLKSIPYEIPVATISYNILKIFRQSFGFKKFYYGDKFDGNRNPKKPFFKRWRQIFLNDVNSDNGYQTDCQCPKVRVLYV